MRDNLGEQREEIVGGNFAKASSGFDMLALIVRHFYIPITL